MKTVFIIRHAKSDQNFFGNDFERPLNERGRTDAPEMAKRLLAKKINIDALVSSPATRAKQTAEFFANRLSLPVSDIVFISALYHASAEVFYETIAALPDSLHTVAIFSHNPGITHFVNSLNCGVTIDNMPTCGIFSVCANIPGWAGFKKSEKKYSFFDFPKK